MPDCSSKNDLPDDPYEWVNPGNLALARKRLGLAPRDVAEQARQLGAEYRGITAEALASWESGGGQPELRHLEALSQIYVCPVGWFFLSSLPAETHKLDFRGVASEEGIGGQGRQTLSRFLELAEWAEGVAVQTGQLRTPTIACASLTDDMNDLVAVERRRLDFEPSIRGSWRKKDDAFNWWRRRIESLGVFCFVMRLPTSEVRGASFRGEHGAAFILVNSEDAEAAAGRTFSLLHEYAHLMLRKSFVCDFRGSGRGTDVESFTNRFAARMLLGPEELRARLKEVGTTTFRQQWGDTFLDKIREPLQVSRDVVSIYLEKELGLAPKGFYARKRATWAKRKAFGHATAPTIGRNLQQRKLRTVGTTLAKVLSSKPAEAALSALDLAEMLDVKVERVPAILETFREAGDEA
ncbi:MAG TPA: XRE family transcriptional regulator [Planctomycetota bacterium]|nr:XRE family transcriptional regulator [Planctomycetota bacterium]